MVVRIDGVVVRLERTRKRLERTRKRKTSGALAALLLGACASDHGTFGGREPLPPSWPTLKDEKPLESMAEFRSDFSLRGQDWEGDLRTGQMRIRVVGEPDRVLRLTEPIPCFVRDCAGAVFMGLEELPTIQLAKEPCRLSTGAVYPYAIKVLLRRREEIERELTGCASPGTTGIPGVRIAETPAAPPQAIPKPTSVDARRALDEEAARLMSTPKAMAPRDWHSLKWLYEGDGVVGRLHDLCTGAVEPAPQLTIGAWSWEKLDPRMLEAADRRRVVDWRSQVIGAAWICGTVFQIGTLGSDARRAVGQCPADLIVDRAFVDYVSRKPELRQSNDPLRAAAGALREAGCSGAQ